MEDHQQQNTPNMQQTNVNQHAASNKSHTGDFVI